MHSAQAACGERLRTMRMEARYTQKEAVRLANKVAEEEGISERFTLRALRRWELLGTAAHNPSNHGTTPPQPRQRCGNCTCCCACTAAAHRTYCLGLNRRFIP